MPYKVENKVEVSASTANAFGAFLALIRYTGTCRGYQLEAHRLTVFSTISESARAQVAIPRSVVLGIGITILIAGKNSIPPEIIRILK